jgi:hypothetical protein
VASVLDLPEACDGVVVAGSPVGKSDFVASFAQESTEAVEDLVDKLAQPFPTPGPLFAPVRIHGVTAGISGAHASLGADGDQVDESVALASDSIQVAADTIIGPDFRARPTAEAQR